MAQIRPGRTRTPPLGSSEPALTRCMGRGNLKALKRIVQAVTTAIAALFAAPVSWCAPAPTNGVPDVFALRPIDWLPAPLKAQFQPVRFPASVRPDRIEQLVSMGGRLWIAARTRGGTNAAAVTLWSLSLPDGRLDPVRGPVERHSIRDLRAGPDGLWMAVDGGAVAMDPRTLILDPFSASEGLTTGNGVAFAYAGRRWFLISDSGALYLMHTDGRSWSRLPGVPGVNARRAGRFERMGGSGTGCWRWHRMSWRSGIMPLHSGMWSRRSNGASWLRRRLRDGTVWRRTATVASGWEVTWGSTS